VIVAKSCPEKSNYKLVINDCGKIKCDCCLFSNALVLIEALSSECFVDNFKEPNTYNTHQRIEKMTTNYIALARENRLKALNGLKHSRRQILPLSDYAVHQKSASCVPVFVFMSSRNPGLFTQANLH